MPKIKTLTQNTDINDINFRTLRLDVTFFWLNFAIESINQENTSKK